VVVASAGADIRAQPIIVAVRKDMLDFPGRLLRCRVIVRRLGCRQSPEIRNFTLFDRRCRGANALAATDHLMAGM
jgi:hypothetical protein